MATSLTTTPWEASADQVDVIVDLHVERIGRKNGFVVWAGTLGNGAPDELVGKTVLYAPSPRDGLLAATVGNEPPFILQVALLRIVGVAS